MDKFLTKSNEPNLFDANDVRRMRLYQTECVILLNTYNRDSTRVTERILKEIHDTEIWLKTKEFLTKL